MPEAFISINNETTLLVVGALVLCQAVSVIYTLLVLRSASKERKVLNRETFGLLRKVEGLLARKQEKITKEYDRLLEQMTLQVPVVIAREAGNEIFETEKYVISRLAELELEVHDDEVAMQKMETIIKTMEGLETTIIRATSKAVERVLVENRRELFSDDDSDSQLAS